MSNIVEYFLNLKDNLSPGIKNATEQVKHLEGALSEAKSMAAGIGTALGIGFAIFEGVKFAKEGLEKVHELHKAEAALKNTMENMGTYSTEAFEKTVEAAKNLSSGILFSRTQVIELQSQLGLVGTIGEDEMSRLTAVSADMATKFGMGLSEAGNMLAKAVNNPEMARRLGMTLKIDPVVMDHIQKLAKAGKEAEARMELLAIAEGKVGGAAKAAFDVNPMNRFNKIMGSMQISIGGLVNDLLEALAPALITIAESMRDVVGFIKEHIEAISILGGVYLSYKATVLGLIGVHKTLLFWQGLSKAAVELKIIWDMYSIGVLNGLTAAQWALNTAMAANPVGLIVAGVVALGAVVYELIQHFGGVKNMFGAVWDFMKEGIWVLVRWWQALGEVIWGVLTLDIDTFKQGLSDIVSNVKTTAQDVANIWNNQDAHDGKKSKSLIPSKPGDAGKPGAVGETIATPKTKAEGQKTINIHIAYNAPLMTGGFTVSTNHFHEGLDQLKEKVSAILVGATHDSLMVADY